MDPQNNFPPAQPSEYTPKTLLDQPTAPVGQEPSGLPSVSTPQAQPPAGGSYDFILQPANVPEKKLGGSLLQRILIGVAGLAVLAIIAAVAVNFFAPKDTAVSQLIGIAQEEQELIRVSTVIAQRSTKSDVKNFAVNVSLSTTTNQQATVKYISSHKGRVNDKKLLLKQNQATDAALATALATNTYDTAAVKTLSDQLSTYQLSLKKAYSETKGKNARSLLQKHYDAATLLTKQANKLAT